MTTSRVRLLILLGGSALALIACGDDTSRGGDRDGGLRQDAGAGESGRGGGAGGTGGGSGSGGTGGTECTSERLRADRVSQVDMLFVVDNSGSMQEEQAALSAQFPAMVRALTTGDRDGDGTPELPPVVSLHLGVVSTDMGVVGVDGLTGCVGRGDDGVLLTRPDPSLLACASQFPRFLEYRQGTDDADALATDLGCISTLGTTGCGFEQQLEAGLKALWPSSDTSIEFLATAGGVGALGHGDQENAGFVRTDPRLGLSVLAVVIVSDEEDCSAADTSHFTPPNQLDPSSPLANQPMNLRCFLNPNNLRPIDRYIDGFRQVRPQLPQLVVFGAIVGVPADLVDAQARAGVDFGDATARSGYYDRILSDTRMQEVPDPFTVGANQGLTPSCITDNDGDGIIDSKAFPPRRIVQVARGFGENGVVQSICQADFTDAAEAIVERVASLLAAPCLTSPFARGIDGKIGCEVLWELPSASAATATTPAACSELPLLEHVGTGEGGGQLCRVPQLAVAGDNLPDGEGWFYDDLTESAGQICPDASPQRITFTAGTTPPPGVRVELSCCE